MSRQEITKANTGRALRPRTQAKAQAQDETESETESDPEEEVESADEFEDAPVTKPGRKPPAEPKKWTPESMIELLAYVEWCIESGKDFWKEQAPLLSQDLGYSTRQIYQKVWSTWKNHRKSEYGDKKYTHLYIVGIKSLKLHDEVIKHVRKRVREIRSTTGSSALPIEPNINVQVRSRRVILKVNPTKLRQLENTGESKAATIGDSQEDEEGEDTETPGSPAHTALPSGSSRGTIDVANDAALDNIHDAGDDMDLDTGMIQETTPDANPQVPASPPNPDDPSGEEGDSFHTVRNSQNVLQPQQEWLRRADRNFSFTTPTKDHPGCNNEATNDLANNTPTQRGIIGSPSEYSPRSLRLDLLEKNKRISLCEEEIRTLRERNAELEGQLKSLQRCKPDANVRHNLEQHFASTRAMIAENKLRHRKIDELSMSDIGRRIIALSNAIRDFGLTNEEISEELPNLESSFGPSAHSWATRTFGKSIRLCIYSVSNREFRKEGLLRGLVAAAINELIFEPVFPHMFNVHSQDTNFYRKYIVVQHGTEDLHHADHHVLKELARDKQTAMIEPTANDLADRISKSLEGLLSTKEDQPAYQEDLDGDFEMLFPESDVDTTTLHLRSVLSQALSLKLDLTMHMNRLRFFFFKPNDLWDAQNMKLDNPSFQPDEGSSIKACISPAIYVAPKREISRDEAILEFDTRFNTYFLEATDEEVKTLELVSQAIVLI